MLLNKIKVHDLTYVVLFLSFLAGYFDILMLLLLLIIIHEFGHFITALYLSKDVKVIIYPFGGITKINTFLNDKILKELIIIIAGPILQILFVLLIFILYKNGFIIDEVFFKINKLNIFLLSFNLLPILPLDGGKIVNNMLDILLPYKFSNKVSILISIIVCIFMVVYFFNNKILYIIILLLLIKNLVFEILNFKNKFNKFVMERVLYNFKYDYGKNINNIKNLKRNKKHRFKVNAELMDEKEYILKHYLNNNFYLTKRWLYTSFMVKSLCL